MDIRPIRTEADYDWALSQIEGYFQREPQPGTLDGDRFEVLSTLVEAYEKNHWPIQHGDPIDILNYAIANFGRTQTELAELLGSRSHASEILARKRPLSLDMIRRISETWDLPAALLLPSYRLNDAA